MKLGVFHSFDHGQYDKLPIFKAAGVDFLEINYYLLANLDEAKFRDIVAATEANGLPMEYGCGLFGRERLYENGKIRESTKEFAKRSFERFASTNLRHLTFGSGYSRATEGEFTPEYGRALITEFIGDFLSPLAQNYGYVIAIEPLRSTQTDVIINSSEGFELVQKINRDNVRLVADYYHLFAEEDDVRRLKEYKGYLSHLHISSLKNGDPPMPDDGEEEQYVEFLKYTMEAVDKDVNLSIETWNDFIDPQTSFKYLRDMIRSLNKRRGE